LTALGEITRGPKFAVVSSEIGIKEVADLFRLLFFLFGVGAIKEVSVG
jgi:hypothetical protein